MLRILAVALIGYGLFELFVRNFLRNFRAHEGEVRQRLTMKMRWQRFKTTLPFYAAILVGTFLLIASLAR